MISIQTCREYRVSSKIMLLFFNDGSPKLFKGPGGSMSQDYLTTHTILSPIRHRFAPGFLNYKKGALDSQPQVIKFTSCLPMVSGSLWVFQLLSPLKVGAMIQLKYC